MGMPIDVNTVTKGWEALFRGRAKYPQIDVKVSVLMGRATRRGNGERATEAFSCYRPNLHTLWEVFREGNFVYAIN